LNAAVSYRDAMSSMMTTTTSRSAMGPMSKRAATTPTVHKSWSAPAADVQDGPASEHQLRAGLFSLMLLLQVAAAAATTTGFDYFSTSNAVSASVVHFTPTFLHSVDEILEDLANQHFDNFQDHIMTTTMQSSTSLRSFSFPDSSTMPSPKRVADPTGVYGQQDAEAEYITADTKPTESRNAMSLKEEVFPQFTSQAAKPMSRTEKMIHSILMESSRSQPAVAKKNLRRF
jgi:hypothetical protein